jgi:hypothetical protein
MTDVFSQPNGAAMADQANVTLNDLVGEGKKFKDADALAKAKIESDAFIEQLKGELAGLRNAQGNLDALQNRIAELEAQKNKSPAPSPNTMGELTQDKLEEIVAGFITKQEQSRTANQNIAAANDAMIRQFGSLDKAQAEFNLKALETGMSVAELKALAAKSPNAFYHVMGINPKAPAPKADLQNSNINTTNLQSNSAGPKPRSAAYYNAKRREIGNAAFFADKQLQKEIFEAKKSGAYDA